MASPNSVKRPHTAPSVSFSNLCKSISVQRCSLCDEVIQKKAFVEVFDANNSERPTFLCSPICYKNFTKNLAPKIPASKIQTLVKTQLAKK